MVNVYKGELRSDGRIVTVNGEPLGDAVTQGDGRQRRPNLEWGYGGSGPNRLAHAILEYEYNNEFAQEWQSQFKNQFVDDLGIDDEWELRGDEVLDYLIDFGPEHDEREELYEEVATALSSVNTIIQDQSNILYPPELKEMQDVQDRLEWMLGKLEEEFMRHEARQEEAGESSGPSIAEQIRESENISL